MEEITLAKSRKALNIIALVLLIVGLVVIVVGLILCSRIYNTGSHYVPSYTVTVQGYTMKTPSYTEYYTDLYSNMFSFFFHHCIDYLFGYVVFAGIAILIATLIIFLQKSNSNVTVTNKRIFGKSSFGKQVDLPLSQVSSLTKSGGNNITVVSSGGKTPFYLISNVDEVYNAMSQAMNN